MAHDDFRSEEAQATPRSAKSNPLTQQVGGDHYKDLKFQPVEFVTANQWDYCAASILKYLTRYAVKRNVVDLQKASHFLKLRAELRKYVPDQGVQFGIGTYCVLNNLPNDIANVLLLLENVVKPKELMTTYHDLFSGGDTANKELSEGIAELIKNHAPA